VVKALTTPPKIRGRRSPRGISHLGRGREYREVSTDGLTTAGESSPPGSSKRKKGVRGDRLHNSGGVVGTGSSLYPRAEEWDRALRDSQNVLDHTRSAQPLGKKTKKFGCLHIKGKSLTDSPDMGPARAS